MAVNYATLQIQVASLLQLLRKREAAIIHARDASSSDFDRRRLTQTNGFSTSDDDQAKVLTALTNYFDARDVQAKIASYVTLRAAIEDSTSGLGLILKEDLNAPASDVASAWIDYAYDTSLTTGQIAILERTGLFGLLRRQMELDAQFVEPHDVEFDPLVAYEDNVGELVEFDESAESHTPSGVVVLECTDDTVDNPRFRVSIDLDRPLPDGREILNGDNDLQAEQYWEDGETGMTMLYRRPGLALPTETLDEGGIFSAVSIATPSERDGNKGLFYERTTRQSTGPTWLIEFFADAAFTRRRGRATSNTAVGTETFTTTLNGGTALTYTFDRAAAAVENPAANDTSSATWDIVTPRIGDRWTRVVVNLDLGQYGREARQAWRGSFPTTGATKWTDANVDRIAVT